MGGRGGVLGGRERSKLLAMRHLRTYQQLKSSEHMVTMI